MKLTCALSPELALKLAWAVNSGHTLDAICTSLTQTLDNHAQYALRINLKNHAIVSIVGESDTPLTIQHAYQLVQVIAGDDTPNHNTILSLKE